MHSVNLTYPIFLFLNAFEDFVIRKLICLGNEIFSEGKTLMKKRTIYMYTPYLL